MLLRSWRVARSVLAAALAVPAVGVSACGGGAGSAASGAGTTPALVGGTIVARVGDRAITKAMVERWTGVIRREGAFIGLRGEPHGTPKQRALALLITSDWLIGEAARQGVAISRDELGEGVANRRHEISEFGKYLRDTGQTTAGVEFEVEAELAAEAIREKLSHQARRFTAAEVTSFYRHNPGLFTSEERVTELIENLSSVASANALVDRVGSGRGFTSMAIHEGVTHSLALMRSPEKAQIVNAIFLARPGIVSRPLLLNGSWTVFVVRKVIPGTVRPLGRVREAVGVRLRESRERALAREFDGRYAARWKARTSCRPEYVGPGCPQFAGQLGIYEDPFSSKQRALVGEPLSPFPL